MIKMYIIFLSEDCSSLSILFRNTNKIQLDASIHCSKLSKFGRTFQVSFVIHVYELCYVFDANYVM